MNRRQAKKELKKEYGIITPRKAPPRLTKRYTLRLVDLAQEVLTKRINELIIKGKEGE